RSGREVGADPRARWLLRRRGGSRHAHLFPNRDETAAERLNHHRGASGARQLIEAIVRACRDDRLSCCASIARDTRLTPVSSSAASSRTRRLTPHQRDDYGIVPSSRPSSTRRVGMAGTHGDMDCPECMDLLADYVDGSLPRHQAELLEWHLEGCGPCVAFVKTYKGTVDAARRLRETPLPPELKEKLRAFLKRSVQQ